MQAAGTSRQALVGGLPTVISTLGQADFGGSLLRLLYEMAAVEHIAAYVIGEGELRGVFTASMDGVDHAAVMDAYLRDGLWRSDPTFDAAADRMSISGRAAVRSNLAQISNQSLRENIYFANNINDRALMCRRSIGGTLALTLCSSRRDYFQDGSLDDLESLLEPIFALLGRHCDLASSDLAPARALQAVAEIESCIRDAEPSLTVRELQVCSRIISGKSAADIAQELAVSIETITTYRKRAYLRLKLSSARELIVWYLSISGKLRKPGELRQRAHHRLIRTTQLL